MMTIRDFFGHPRRPGLIGLEVEVEADALPHTPEDYWRSINDGSLRGPSGEYVLPRPVNLPEAIAAVKQLHLAFKRERIEPHNSPRCAVHVHLNCLTLSVEKAVDVALVFFLFESLLSHYCGALRQGNFFSLQAHEAPAIVSNLIRLRRNIEDNMLFNQTYRYAFTNMAALRHFGSLEIRGLGTPQNLLEIIPWVEGLAHLYNFAQQTTALQVVEDLSQLGFVEVIQQALTPDLLARMPANKEELRTLLYLSVRAVQAAIYTRGPR